MAKDTLAEIRRLLGEDSTDTSPLFPDVWARYYNEEGRYRGTARDIRRRGKLFVALWRDRPVLGLSTVDVENYRDLRRGQITRRGLPPTPASLNREIATARHVLEYAVKQRWIPYNPLARLTMLQENNVRKSKIRSEAELEQLLEHADRTMRALILAQIDCGFRRMEIFTLEWTQIFLLPHTRRDGTQVERPMVELWSTKTVRGRLVKIRRRAALSERTYEAIQALPRYGRYVFVGRESGRYRGPGTGGEAPPRPGTHLNPDATLKKFQRLVARAGIHGIDDEQICFHTLRHSFAYISRVVHKASQAATKMQGGWKTDVTFQRYGIGGEEELADMYDQVDASIAAATKPPPKG